MILHVKEAKYLDHYRIWVLFNNGAEGVANLEDLLWGEMFEPLKTFSTFAQFTIDTEMQTLTWPNGADLAPEAILERLYVA
mgnify:CR=1 FL=1